MSMMVSQMRIGRKVIIDGYADDEEEVYLSGHGIIMDSPDNVSRTVKVKYKPEDSEDITVMNVPVDIVFWIDQNANIGFEI